MTLLYPGPILSIVVFSSYYINELNKRVLTSSNNYNNFKMPRRQKNAMKPENPLYSRMKKTVVDTLNVYNVSEIILATVGANEKATFFFK